jgi:peptidoglycan/xylan/chitin deacetylase (PgdA/CDA1 family)
MLRTIAMQKAVSRLLRRVSPSRIPGEAVLLMYHRVGDMGSNGGGTTVSATRFAEHLQALRARFLVVPLGDLVGSLAEGKVPRRSVAITFDDGYVDNLTVAKPILERHDVPATVFVVSGYVGSGRRFWWDELEWICTAPHMLPGRLELTIRAEAKTWSVGSNAERRPLFRELREALGPLEAGERDEVLSQLRSWAGLVENPDEVETMTVEQLHALARDDTVEIGAHTVTHPRLPAVSPERQLEEIRGSVRQLESILGRPVTLFSYPFGAHDRTTVTCAHEARVACACTTVAGGVHGSTDRYRVPRLYVGDWPADELVARVSTRLI